MAFRSLKEQLSSRAILAHYDSSLPLRLACDASSYGVRAVISHVFPDGSEKPVAYGSHTLTKAEKNYPQIEKEALAIVLKKFHQYIYSRNFTLITDHKPLVAILGPRKGLPALAAARLQHWAVTLSAYSYDVRFRPTEKHCMWMGSLDCPYLVILQHLLEIPQQHLTVQNGCLLWGIKVIIPKKFGIGC